MKKGRLKIHATGFQTAFPPFTHASETSGFLFFYNSAAFHHGVLTMARGIGHSDKLAGEQQDFAFFAGFIVVKDGFAHGAEAE